MADNDWTELSIFIPDADDEKRDVAIALLADAGFESFSNTETGVLAYIRNEAFTSETVNESGLLDLPMFKGCNISHRIIEKTDWNVEWEKSFSPVIIAKRCSVRPPLHQKPEGTDYDIVISPHMSFGTGHHQTTALMTELLLDVNVKGLRVLDMGCGTGILAILSFLKGASEVIAVDIDEWACDNTRENALLNKSNIVVRKGDIASVAGEKYDIILANITRNILLENMETLCSCLAPGGYLMLSGFYRQDLHLISTATESSGLALSKEISKDEWSAVAFSKP